MNVVATYRYRDEAGTLLFEKLRLDPKDFRFRFPLAERHKRPLSIPPNETSWVWGFTTQTYGRKSVLNDFDLYKFDEAVHQQSVELEGPRRVLYRLPELLGANPESPVFFVEGEKDVDLLRSLGFVATCTPCGGAALAWEWLSPLAGRRVVVIPDNDVKGRGHGTSAAGVMVALGVRSLRIISPTPGVYEPGDGGDAGDWLSGSDRKDWRQMIIDLCKQFPEYKS